MWHLSNFSKRCELLIKPSGFGYNSYNQPITVKIPVQIIPYLVEAYHIGFADIEDNILCYSCRKFSPGTNEVEYYVKVGSIDDINYTHLFIYYDILNEYVLSNCDMCEGLQVYEYINDGTSHPSNHSELLDCYCLDSSIYNSYTTQSVYLSKGSDYYCYLVTGWFYIPNELSGVWGFALDSDNAAEVEIDGSVIVGWYEDHVICGCYSFTGFLQLDAGWHKFIARHENRVGGGALRVYVRDPTVFTYSDCFDGDDGDSPNPVFWSRSHGGNATTPQILSNKLQLYVGEGSSGWAKATHEHKFVGDFDITVDYELASGYIDEKGGWGSLGFYALTGTADTFDGADGDSYDSNKWERTGTYSNANSYDEIYNNKYRFHLDTDESSDQYLIGKEDLYGDFDVQVTFNMSDNTAISHFFVGLGIRNATGFLGIRRFNYSYSRQIVIDEDEWWNWYNYAYVSYTYNKFRIVREGNHFIFYCWNGSAWSFRDDNTYSGFGSDPIRVELRITKSTAIPEMNVDFDNLSFAGIDVRMCRSRDRYYDLDNGYRVLINGEYSNRVVAKDDLSGKLRLSRVGSTLSCYFFRDSSYMYLLDSMSITKHDATIELHVNNYADYPEMDFRFNNFTTSSGWEVMGTSIFKCTSYAYTGPAIYTGDFIDNSIYDMTSIAIMSVFSEAYIVSYLDFTSTAGTVFSNHGASLHQPICDIYAVKVVGGTSYLSCNISKSTFTLFFNCYLVNCPGYLVYFSSSNYVYVNSDGSLVAKINGTEYSVGSKLYSGVCSTFSITCDGSNTYIVMNGLTKLIIKQTFSISEIRLGGNGSSGYSIECYFFDFFLLPSKLPLYLYYLHNTRYDSVNYFRESGHDNVITNGYLTSWPEVIFAGDEVIFRSNSCSGIVYSVSFNNGSSWYVSGLGYEDIFTKYFGSPSELDTVLRLTSSSGTIDKDYIVKVNDFNQFDVNCLVDFTAGTTRDGHKDTETDFIVALPTLSGTKTTPVEYTYEVDAANLKPAYLDKPVEYSWGGTLGSGVISKDVEYCFDIVMDSWADDTEIDFWLGELYQGYYRNYYTYLTLSSGWASYVDFGVDFVLANWKYFPTQANIICSTTGYNDQETETNVGKGSLMRFLSDIKASDMIYDDFSSSIFCSLSGIFPDCFSEIQVISGSIGSYESNICCSLLDISSSFAAEIKLNTVVIENFNINETVIVGTDFCFSVDVYDMYYGVTTSGIQVYMNTNIITGNEVVNKTFLTISGGHTVSWCYNIGELSPSEYIEIIVKCTNEYGDLNIASYFLRYGKRYYYNLYHITKHDYEMLIPMLMVAENNVSVFPSFSTESMYVIVENYKRKNLGASIFGVSLDKGDIQAEVVALTNNFYNGGHYKVRVECNDLSGNVMNPLEFEFTIRSDGL